MFRIIYFLIVLVLVIPSAFAGSRENEEDIEDIKTGNKDRRIEAIHDLGSRGINATQKAAMELIPLLDDRDNDVKIAAIEVLGDMKWEAKRAVPKLIEMVERNDETSYYAAQALLKIGSIKGRKAAEKYLRQ